MKEYAIIVWKDAKLFAHSEGPWGELETFSDLAEAQKCAERLEGEGVECRIISLEAAYDL